MYIWTVLRAGHGVYVVLTSVAECLFLCVSSVVWAQKKSTLSDSVHSAPASVIPQTSTS